MKCLKNESSNKESGKAVKQLIRQQAAHIRRMTPDEYIRYRKAGDGSRN